MTLPAKTRLFTIGEAVSDLRSAYPDMSHSALRFLQREGLVNPLRTVGGHRLFTVTDLDRIRQIKHWQAHRFSLAEIRQRLENMDALASPSHLAQRLLELAIHGEMAAATQLILHADDIGLPMTPMFDEVLRPALVEVGERWVNGLLTVGQEHEISELSRDLIAELTLRHAEPDPLAPIVVAACIAEELHDLGLRMVCGILRERGARVHYLGANVSPAFLSESVVQRRAEIVLLSISLEAHMPALRETIRILRDTPADWPRPRIIAGGKGCLRNAEELAEDDVMTIVDRSLEQIVNGILTVSSWASLKATGLERLAPRARARTR
jgi:DNA-binding transcriptional MerR regulator/methylmalonyl-CoA mutase cobalamin-binding subunit